MCHKLVVAWEGNYYITLGLSIYMLDSGFDWNYSIFKILAWLTLLINNIHIVKSSVFKLWPSVLENFIDHVLYFSSTWSPSWLLLWQHYFKRTLITAPQTQHNTTFGNCCISADACTFSCKRDLSDWIKPAVCSIYIFVTLISISIYIHIYSKVLFKNILICACTLHCWYSGWMSELLLHICAIRLCHRNVGALTAVKCRIHDTVHDILESNNSYGT